MTLSGPPVWLVVLTSLDVPPCEHEAALRDLLRHTRSWASGYARRRFSNDRRMLNDLDDLVEDAVQHLLIQASHGAMRLKGMDPQRAKAWCKKVIANFILSELRLRARHSTLPPPSPEATPGIEQATASREALKQLARALHAEVERRARPQDAEQQRALIGDFLSSIFAQHAQFGGENATSRQRRSRGRRLAARVWTGLKSRGPIAPELCEVAAALGLETERGIDVVFEGRSLLHPTT